MIPVHVIHLSERTDRYELALREADEHGLTLIFHDGIRAVPAKVGINLAHKKVIQHAKDNNLPEVCAAEDDFHVLGKGAVEYFVNNKPSDYDLYLASVYFGHIRPDNTVNEFCGLTFYYCHRRFYDTFLSLPRDKSIDRAMKGLGKFVVCQPFVVIQHETPSDNSKFPRIHLNSKHLAGRKLYTDGMA